MLAEVQRAQHELAEIKQLIVQEQYTEATQSLANWQHLLQRIFLKLPATDTESQQQLQQLAEECSALLPTMIAQRQQLKDSISQMAGVKSGNKVSKTYQID